MSSVWNLTRHRTRCGSALIESGIVVDTTTPRSIIAETFHK